MLNPTPIYKGAEANLYVEDGKLIKHRVKKEYRIDELDRRLRKQRTTREVKILENARRIGINVPKVYETNISEYKIVMEFIKGEPLRDIISNSGDDRVKEIALKMGRIIAKMHKTDLIHNDLTTSNMLMHENEIYVIDFGLSSMSRRVEEKAMDIVVLKKSLRAMYPSRFGLIWSGVCEGYKDYSEHEEILKRAEAIEKRARYL